LERLLRHAGSDSADGRSFLEYGDVLAPELLGLLGGVDLVQMAMSTRL
jgi:hypothetical protein